MNRPFAGVSGGLKVALVSRGATVAGGEVSLLTLARHLPAPWRPLVWVTEKGELAERAREEGLEVVEGSWSLLSPRRPVGSLRAVAETVAALRAHRVDLVHVNSPVEAMPFLAAARLLRRPILVHVRIAYRAEFLRGQGLRLADEVIFNSCALREEIGWSGGAVVPNGVELPPPLGEEERLRLRRELGAGGEEILLGQVGQVIEVKGVDLSLRAFARLVEKGLPVRLAIVGDDHQAGGSYRREMESLAGELGVADRVVFTGYRRDALALMGVLDLLLCPSRKEPFGRVLIEAMSQGVPSVAAAVGGIPEVVRDGAEGLLIGAEDAEALARAVELLAADPARRGAMGRRGRERARDEFSAPIHARRIAALYERVGAPYILPQEVER